MRPGDKFKCPKCGSESVLVRKPVIEGWTKKGEILACALCSAKAADYQEGADLRPTSESTDKLASFLGVEKTKQKRIEVNDKEKRFCRDCAHYIVHPFHDRCSLRNTNVNPMDDCPQFSAKKRKSESP